MADLEKFVQHMINLCNDDSHGYDQGNRWGPDYDCSSSIITSLKAGGFDTGNASYTGNLSVELCARGWDRLSASVTKMRGDICLNDANHVELYIGNNQLAGFSQNEFGGVTGGQTGDQTGQEAHVHAYYDYPWDCVLRYGSGSGQTGGGSGGASTVTIPAPKGQAGHGGWSGTCYLKNGTKITTENGFIVDVEVGAIDVNPGGGSGGGSGTMTGTPISGNRYLSDSEMLNNAQIIKNYLTSQGWSANAVYGLLGNMQSESTINPGIWESLADGNTSGGYGLVQWTPATKYISWAQANGKESSNIYSQLDRICWEAANGEQWIPTSSYPMSFSDFIKSTDSPYNLAMAFLANYERPYDANQPIRGTQAQSWASRLN